MKGVLQNVFIITYNPKTHKKEVSYLVWKAASNSEEARDSRNGF